MHSAVTEEDEMLQLSTLLSLAPDCAYESSETLVIRHLLND